MHACVRESTVIYGDRESERVRDDVMYGDRERVKDHIITLYISHHIAAADELHQHSFPSSHHHSIYHIITPVLASMWPEIDKSHPYRAGRRVEGWYVDLLETKTHKCAGITTCCALPTT